MVRGFCEISADTCVKVEMCMIGPLETNVYILFDKKAAIVVDPAGEPDMICEALQRIGKPLEAIVLTHGHSDHVGAASVLRDKTGSRVFAYKDEVALIQGDESPINRWPAQVPCPVDEVLLEGDLINVGETQWRVIHTPGHSQGSMCLYTEGAASTGDLERKPVLIAGDTLFYGTIGRTDLRGGNIEEMKNSLKILSKLPDETVVLTGHGSLTAIGAERVRVFSFFCR